MKTLLKDRERTIIELRFGLDGHKPKTQNEIAKMMGISRSYVSRIETKAIGKLSKEIKEQKEGFSNMLNFPNIKAQIKGGKKYA